MSNKKKALKKKEVKSGLDSDVKRSILVILMIVLSVFSALGLFGKAGTLGTILTSMFKIFFGWGMYVVPVLLMATAFVYIAHSSKHTNKTIIWAVFLFLFSILGLFAISNYEEAQIRGGYIGFVVAWPLVRLLGTLGTFVVLVSSLFISLIIGLHLKVNKVFLSWRERRSIRKSSLEVSLNKDSDKKLFFNKDKLIGKTETKVEVKDYHASEDVNEKAIDKKHKDKIKKEDEFSTNVNKRFVNFVPPPTDLLDKETGKPTSGDIIANANIIKRTLRNFGIDVEMSEVNVGPTVTQYTLKPAEGVKLTKITALNNDLALALATHPIRIEAPIPGRSLVGIEIPNKVKTWVRLRDLLEHPTFKEHKGTLITAMGRDVKGAPVYADISTMPHILIAGSTGTGKTIALNAIILSLLYKNPPQSLRFIMIDPKRVEFSVYRDIPNLLSPIIVDNNKVVNALKWAIGEMERRFEVLAEANARDIKSYNSNKRIIETQEILPYIAIIIDELADLMSAKGKEVEALIVRIAQMARAVGIHLVLATQRPSVEVITGLIKANITARMAFQVASQVDSRTVLDGAGAEKLLGGGDMLFLSPERSKPVRIQGAYVGESEVKKVVDYLRKEQTKLAENRQVEVQDFSVSESSKHAQSLDFDGVEDGDEELYEEAKNLVIKSQKASASYLQRRLRIGYARAARFLDIMEERGVVGPGFGAKPRDVYVGSDDSADIEHKDDFEEGEFE